MTDDVQLLRRYAEEGSEAAFADLVRRHVDLVYSAALRWTGGDAHLAQDVAQSVFTDLARKARTLPRAVVLTGWLYQATRFAAAKVVRTERRRVNREQEAVAMQDQSGETPLDWEQLNPHLDEALSSLPASDRDAVLLRFFEKKEFREVGVALGWSEEAARKRVTRALDKLRAALAQKGVPVSSATLAAALIAGAVQTAPAAVATSIAATAVAATAVGGTTLALIKLMSITNLKIAVAGAVIVAGLATPLVIQQQKLAKLRAENLGLLEQGRQADELRAENDRLAKLKVDADELNRLRGQNAELLRLRGEVTRLRNEKTDAEKLRAENARLRAANGRPAAVNEPPKTEAEEFKTETIARMNTSKQWALAFIMFAENHAGQLPQNFDEAKTKAGKNQLDDSLFEVVTTGKWRDFPEPARTVILREREARRSPEGKFVKTYAFADGHAEAITSLNGDFAELEKSRDLIVGAK